MKIRLVVTGRAYHQADGLPEQLELPATATLDDALAAVDRLLPADVQLPPSCLISLSGRHVGAVARHEDQPLVDGAELTLISPVAGG